MSVPPNTLAGKKKPANRGGKLAQEERSAERTQEKKTIEKAKDQFKDEERKRFAILAKNPSDEDLDQFSESRQDRELFVELVKFLQKNGELESYLSYIKNLKKTGDEFDSYTILTLLQFIKSNKSKPLADKFEQSDSLIFFGNLDRVLSDETEHFQKFASTFITKGEQYALDMKIKSLQTRTEKFLETLPFKREPGKYGPRPNLDPEQYQEYDYRNLSKFWNDQENKQDLARAPIWRPNQNDQNASNDQNDPFQNVKFWNDTNDTNDRNDRNENVDKNKQSQNPLVISFNELESGLTDEIKKSYLQSFGRNFS